MESISDTVYIWQGFFWIKCRGRSVSYVKKLLYFDYNRIKLRSMWYRFYSSALAIVCTSLFLSQEMSESQKQQWVCDLSRCTPRNVNSSQNTFTMTNPTMRPYCILLNTLPCRTTWQITISLFQTIQLYATSIKVCFCVNSTRNILAKWWESVFSQVSFCIECPGNVHRCTSYTDKTRLDVLPLQ